MIMTSLANPDEVLYLCGENQRIAVMWTFLIILWLTIAGAFISYGVDGWLAMLLSLAILVLTVAIIGMTGKHVKPTILSPEFTRPELPFDGDLKDIDIEAEYKARQDKWDEMIGDQSVELDDIQEYYEKRIHPFKPFGQYWNGVKWKDCKPGVEYPEWKLHPGMLNPLGQKFSHYSRRWYDYEKLRRQLARRDWWDNFLGLNAPVRSGR